MSLSDPATRHPAPAVSVVIAVHNGLPYVEQALRSMMEQSLRDIEIIVVDDASSDATPEVLARLASEDARLRIATLAQNIGLTRALNHGLDLAQAPYVARLDADDTSEPKRLEIQKAYLDRNPDVVLLGTSVARIDRDGRIYKSDSRARSDALVRWQSRFYMPLTHPSFMFRRIGPDGNPLRYTSEVSIAQDYDFVAKSLKIGKVAVLPDILIRYRIHSQSMTTTKKDAQIRSALQTAKGVQAQTLPLEIVDGLVPFLNLHYQLSPAPKTTTHDFADVFAGFRRMIRYDIQRYPRSRAWMMRQAAAQIQASCVYNRIDRRIWQAGFLMYGKDFVVPRLLYSLERRGNLPAFMRSLPPDQ